MRKTRQVSMEIVVFALVSLISITASSVKGRETIFVTPDNNTRCPGEPCYTFNDLFKIESIGPNITIYFLPGRHYASEGAFTPFGILKANHIELIGEYATDSVHNATTLIECARPLVFVFGYSDYVRISRLSFRNCGATTRLQTTNEQTIYIETCKNVSIERVSITGGKKSGIMVNYVDYLNITTTIISHTGGTEPLAIYYVRNVFLTNMTSMANSGHFALMKSRVTFQGNTLVHQNKQMVIAGIHSSITFDTNSVTVIKDNFRDQSSAEQLSGVVQLMNSTVTFSRNCSVKFQNNTAPGSGGILAIRSRLIFDSNSEITFLRNVATNGGGLSLHDKSALYFMSNEINVQFIENRAHRKGGGIFVEDMGYVDFTFHEVSTPIAFCNGNLTPIVQLINNTAKVAGDEIYGGWVDWPNPLFSGLRYAFDEVRFNNFNTCQQIWFTFHKRDNATSSLSSNPIRICMCTDSVPDCNIGAIQDTLYPGQILEIEAVAVGQRLGTVPATVVADFTETSFQMDFEKGQNIQSVNTYCSPLQYTILTPLQEAVFELYPANSDGNPILRRKYFSKKQLETIQVRTDFVVLFYDFAVSVKLTDCPLGSIFNYIGNRCTCHPTLEYNGIVCNTRNFSVDKLHTKWINATFTHILNNTKYGILVHDHCPFDYCDKRDISINLESPQDQCDFNRSDILCGACRSNFSHVFGTSRCKKCSNLWVLLIVPTVILAGIALVAFLMILDLTVSIGIINGLIFYANIVRANQAVFFPTKEANTFLNIFIAWLNLDLGVETCFYDGLDAYTITWLQFIFPFYIWLLVTLIIVSSHYSSTVSRWSGSNAVQVLATLFLLSYVKLLRLIITVFLSTVITYPDGYTRRVWFYDGNVDFLKGKHIPLFIAALMTLVVLTVPYTITLTTIQWLQRHKSCKRVLFWVHKFKPIFDAHTGPYKSKHRYWTGVLLLFRVALLLIFTINLSGDPSVNLLAITVSILSLSMYFLFIGGPYESKLINLIEISFYFNACILSTTTIYRLKIESNSTAVTTVSTSIAFVIFMIIVFYHAIQRITETRRGATLKHSVKERVMVFMRQSAPAINTITGQQGTTATQPNIPHSSIELKEPLLANVEQIKQD